MCTLKFNSVRIRAKLPLLKDFLVFSSFPLNLHAIDLFRGTPENRGGKSDLFVLFRD